MSNNEFSKLNHKALNRAFQSLRKNFYSKNKKIKILLISPYYEEYLILKKYFPFGAYYASTKSSWDINFKYPYKNNFNLIVACNVFMYSNHPLKWFNNVLDHTNFLLIQDLVIRKRNPSYPYLGGDQDRTRYRYSSKGIKSNFKKAFDLKKIENRILYFDSYEGDRNEFHVSPIKAPMHFCSIIRGKSELNFDGITNFRLWNLRSNLYWIIFKSRLKKLFPYPKHKSKG